MNLNPVSSPSLNLIAKHLISLSPLSPPNLIILSPYSLTVDNGSEWTYHEQITANTGVSIFFYDPYSSWQRGSNENANVLLRGYLPKKTNIDDLMQDELDDIAFELNNRPRKRLGYKTPIEIYEEEVYSLSSVAVDSRI